MGAKPPTELWELKSSALEFRVGGLIKKINLDKALFKPSA